MENNTSTPVTPAKKEKKEKPARFTMLTGTVESFISDGFSEITSVGEEFREIYDNAPENLQQTDLNQTRDETATTIEGLDEPSVSSSILEGLECSCQIDNGKMYRGRMSQSRACRAGNGVAMLRAAAEAIQEWLDNNDEMPDISDDTDAEQLEERAAFLRKLEEKGWDADDYNEAREEAEDVVSTIEGIADEVDGLEFPGMFG